MGIEDIIEILAIELLGVVPDDEDIIVSTNRGEPVVMDRRSRAGQAYSNIARRLEGIDVPLLSLEDDGWIARLKKAILGHS